MKKLVECVPNFSEGRDMAVIRQITDEIESVKGIHLLNVDPGRAANRTVVTFVGNPEQVAEAAFRAVRMASEIIDMSRHQGVHPRFGATDVLPLIPVSGVSMDETILLARSLAAKIGEELSIPVYCYEKAAFSPARMNLANIRMGGYEGLPQKLADPSWKPDYGPSTFNRRSGAIAVGARNFLIAYNVNLNTPSVKIANSIAVDVREKGRLRRSADGLPVVDEKGEPVYTPGSLKAVRAIGWYIEEYGMTQVSMNLTDLSVTSLHHAFEEVSARAVGMGIKVTGSEIIGLTPLSAMTAAGKYFLNKKNSQGLMTGSKLVKEAISSLGLNDLYPFIPEEKIIEYRMKM